MRNIILATALFVSSMIAAPAFAIDPGGDPSGNWSCVLTGGTNPTGILTMTSSDYAYRVLTVGTALPFSGTGSYTIDKNIIYVSSGPLREELNVHVGYFNTRVSPPVLAFNMGVGRGLTCRTDSDL